MSAETSWLHHAFGFTGRANRAKFWLIPLVPLAVSVTLVAVVATARDAPFSPIAAGLMVFAMILTIWISLAVTVRRLHDRDKSGHWAWLYIGVPAVLDGLTVEFTVFSLIGLGISIWYLVDCGFLRGTRGPNRFGPDPLSPSG